MRESSAVSIDLHFKVPSLCSRSSLLAPLVLTVSVGKPLRKVESGLSQGVASGKATKIIVKTLVALSQICVPRTPRMNQDPRTTMSELGKALETMSPSRHRGPGVVPLSNHWSPWRPGMIGLDLFLDSEFPDFSWSSFSVPPGVPIPDSSLFSPVVPRSQSRSELHRLTYLYLLCVIRT